MALTSKPEGQVKYDGFRQYLTRPEVKYMMSRIKPAEDEDVDLVRTLLETMFNGGFDKGSGYAAEEMLISMADAIKKIDKRGPL